MEPQTPSVPITPQKPKKKVWGVVYDIALLIFLLLVLLLSGRLSYNNFGGALRFITAEYNCNLFECYNFETFSYLWLALLLVYLVRILRNRVNVFNNLLVRILIQAAILIIFYFTLV